MSSVTNSASGSHDSYAGVSLLDAAFGELEVSEFQPMSKKTHNSFLSCLRNREQNANWRQTHIYECQSSIIQNACLKTEFPRLKNIFDKAVWVDLFGQAALDAQGLIFDEEVPNMATRRYNMRVVDSYELEKIPATVGRAEEDPGISELTLPRNFTLNKLIALVEGLPALVNQVRFRSIADFVKHDLGDKSLEKTSRIAIANGILQKSRGMTYGEQEKLLKERVQQELAKQVIGKIPNEKLVKEISGEMPDVLTASTLAILTYMNSSPKSPIRLFSDIPWTYTRCKEHRVVGGFDQDGLRIYNGFVYTPRIPQRWGCTVVRGP